MKRAAIRSGCQAHVSAALVMWCVAGVGVSGTAADVPRASALWKAVPGGVRATTEARQTFTFAGSPTVLLVWHEGEGGDHWAISRDGRQIDMVRRTANLVRLRYATFDPVVHVPVVPAELAASKGYELHLVQFVGTSLEEMRTEVEAQGASIKRFLTDNTHVVRMDEVTAARVQGLPFVRWVGPYHPAYRLDERTLGEIAAGNGGDGAAGAWRRYGIELMEGGLAAHQEVADFITAAGGLVERTGIVTRRMEATLMLEQVAALAHRNDVNFIDSWGPPETYLDIARQMSGAVPMLSNAGFLGQGVRGEVVDTGIQMNHPEWSNPARPPVLHGPVNIFNSVNHGTNVYGCLFSKGAEAQATGFLPQYEAGIFGHMLEVIAADRILWTLESVNPAGPFRVVFQTNSWGMGRSTGFYTTASAELDHAIHVSNLLITQAQGNLGTVESSVQAWAKNVVAVGGIVHNNSLNPLTHTRGGASIGPAVDGRVKPDLAHFYDNIFTATGGSAYRSNFGGTSAATPLTAGSFGLVMQMWHEGVWPGFGGQATVFASRPHYATAKALVIASAFRYNWTSGTPANSSLTRNVQGWGLAHAGRLYELRDRTFVVNGTDSVTTGISRSYLLEVGPGEPELLVTMVYDDPPGNPAAVQARINDLDLKAVSPSGAIYLGNDNLRDDNWSMPAGAGAMPNTVDTVENIFVQNPEAGLWRIEVIGSQIVADTVPSVPGMQANFALVVLGASADGPPCYANCDGSSMEPILTVDDFTCFINAFAEAQGLPHEQQIAHYANCDGSTVPPVLTVDDFTCFVNAFAAGCE